MSEIASFETAVPGKAETVDDMTIH